MKQHLALGLLLGLLHTSRGGFLDWLRGESDQPDGHKVGKVYIEVLSPKGVRLWTHYNPNTALFGVELYVKFYGGQTEALECGLCNTTAEPIDGKFMLEDDNLVARFGDVLEYTVVTSNGSTTRRHPVRRVFVREELIKPIDRCVCRDQEPPPVPLQSGRRISEVQLLERMILRALSNLGESTCEAISNWLVLQSEPRNELADLDEYVRLYLDLLYLRTKKTSPGYGRGWSPSAAVVKVEDHAHGIAFQVRSTMDKLKILELLNVGRILSDFDGIL
uniref:CBM39 domain-containing protein n=1 Tax=Anopheles atroparvus TaxID=41427 RepID=A0AAG5DU12_ANOAO